MVDQIFDYYEACKFDKLLVEEEEPILKSQNFFAAAIDEIKKNGLADENRKS